jgi:hypothetical protein
MLANHTRNQHFVARVEQKLNAANPQAADRNLRIYSFRLIDRKGYQLELKSRNGRSIDNNLSLFDLFSFDVSRDSDIRMNFEALFQRYETSIETYTRRLLAKLSSGRNDVKEEVIGLFAAKLLNFIRNPYSIKKMMNTFPKVGTYEPVDPVLLNSYRRILGGKKPQQKYLCSQLGISDGDYIEWLRALFILLMPAKEAHPNVFEHIIKSLLENRKTQVVAYVHEYDANTCLLSDRGFSQPVPDGPHMGFSFNLCSNAFIDYLFVDVGAMFQNRFAPRVIESYHNRPEVAVNVVLMRNNLPMLKRYNRRVVEQCYEHVYCATPDGFPL